MIVCLCHRVSDRDIAREVRAGCDSFDALQQTLKVSTGCGACRECAEETFAQACASADAGTPVLLAMRSPVHGRGGVPVPAAAGPAPVAGTGLAGA